MARGLRSKPGAAPRPFFTQLGLPKIGKAAKRRTIVHREITGIFRYAKWMSRLPRLVTGGTLNILIFSALTLGGAFLFRHSLNRDVQKSQEEIGRIIEKSGNVTVKTGKTQGWLPAQDLNPVYNKTSVYTAAASQAAVQVRDTVIRIDEKTLIQLIDPQKKTELFMDFGGLHLSAKKKEEVILNVGGDRIKVSLNASTVRIKREKKSRTLKIESVTGQVKIESATKPAAIVAEGEALSLDIKPTETAPAEPQPEPVAVEKLKLNFESTYSQDDVFSRRPTLNMTVPSDVRDAKFEFSEDGQEWRPLENGRFSPDKEGDYLVRARGFYRDGSESETEPAPWNPKFEHFQLRQPSLRKQAFKVDPTAKPRNKILFRDFPGEIKALEFRVQSGRIVKVPVNGEFPAAMAPAGTEAVRLAESTLPFALDPNWTDLQIRVTKPSVAHKNGIISVRPIRLEQYFYEGVIEEEDRALELNQNYRAEADCAAACTVAVRFKSHLNPQWSSQVTRIKIQAPPPAPPIREMAATEAPNEVATERLQLEPLKQQTSAPWVFEAGIGGNYINMATSSALTSATSSGFSGPGIFASGERQLEDYSLKASYLGIFTKMKNVSSTSTTTQNLAWQSVWAGITQPGAWWLKKFEYGVTYQQMPLFYQSSDGGGEFQNASTLGATVGFNTSFSMGQSGKIVWDQRLLIPALSNGGGSVTSFSPRFGIEGNLSYYHCIANNWALGGSWLGQYMNARFSLREEPGLQAESPTTSMFNSNFQIRLQYGLCGLSANQTN